MLANEEMAAGAAEFGQMLTGFRLGRELVCRTSSRVGRA
jgi:hypothetical protein